MRLRRLSSGNLAGKVIAFVLRTNAQTTFLGMGRSKMRRVLAILVTLVFVSGCGGGLGLSRENELLVRENRLLKSELRSNQEEIKLVNKFFDLFYKVVSTHMGETEGK